MLAASGEHACTLHWIRNDGDVRDGDLLLLDAGVELDSLYTADVTRTLPVNGRFSDDQRMVYDAVLEAQQAGIAAAQPGATFFDVHEAAVAGDRPPPRAVGAAAGHRRGLAGRRRRPAPALDGARHVAPSRPGRARLRPGPAGELPGGHAAARDGLTVEPGLYFKADDELVPERLRGIGVRIEDDIVITETGYVNLSDGLPRTSADVERWMAAVWAGGGDPRLRERSP